MQMNYRKAIKLAALIVSTLLIATVSAATYSYMYIQGSGTITSGLLSWAKGADAPSGSVVAGATVTGMNFSILADSPMNFTDSLHLVNVDTLSHTFSIESTRTAGDGSQFSTFDMVIYASGGARVAKISIKAGESASSLSIPGSATLYVRFEINPVTGQSSGYMAFTVKLTYVV